MNRVSQSTARRVIQYWLDQTPKKMKVDFLSTKHLILDGTLLHRPRGIYAAMDAENHSLVDAAYNIREGGIELLSFYEHLAETGLILESAIKYLRVVWPEIILQRCIVHVQRQGLSWCRRNPKRIEAKELRELFLKLTEIQTKEESLRFVKGVNAWERRFGLGIKTSTNRGRVFSDIIRARSMLLKALPSLFQYLDNSKIPRSTNALEGYFSRLKEHYRLHRGLSKMNKQKYFLWYFFLKPK